MSLNKVEGDLNLCQPAEVTCTRHSAKFLLKAAGVNQSKETASTFNIPEHIQHYKIITLKVNLLSCVLQLEGWALGHFRSGSSSVPKVRHATDTNSAAYCRVYRTSEALGLA